MSHYSVDRYTIMGINYIIHTSLQLLRIFNSYQTNSTTVSTITGIYVRIWSGKPGVAGSTVLWGNMSTNCLGSTSFANVYRVLAVNGGVSRPCMKVVANTPGLILNAGSYWAEWFCTGSLASGPWVPPVVTANKVTGNAIQSTNAGASYYDVLYNNFTQGFPFVVDGTEIINPFMIIQNITIPYGQTNCYKFSPNAKYRII